MSLQNPFQSLSQVCWVGQNDFRSKLRRSVVLLLLSIFNYPFRINIQQESSFHEFLTHLNKIENSIQFTMEKQKEGCLPFLELLVKHSPSGHLLSAVYRKPTHSDRYLNFRSEHPIQHKQSVVNTLTLLSSQKTFLHSPSLSPLKKIPPPLNWDPREQEGTQHSVFTQDVKYNIASKKIPW